MTITHTNKLSWLKYPLLILTLFFVFIAGFATRSFYRTTDNILWDFEIGVVTILSPLTEGYALLEDLESAGPITVEQKQELLCFLISRREDVRLFVEENGNEKPLTEHPYGRKMMRMVQGYLNEIHQYLPDSMSSAQYREKNC
ncbi:hypothetical protein [Marinimicrobium agarilyticum]|uniref:hypothetical protein n=1 Tax=Marinimicrobium agarilyticum TaxID=306546 RepID=UPI000486E224|nr:hypothetical protein [Marinimicrobium agarilyticum]